MVKTKKEIYTFEQLRRECNLTDTFKPKKYHQNDLVISRNSTGTSVIIDKSTGLMWSKPDKIMITAGETDLYIDIINKSNFFGFDDWRLPTIGELLTMAKPENDGSGCFWSSDHYNDSDKFSFSFFTGSVSWSKYPRLINLVRNHVS